ncbi:MAG: magnesium transporter CorA family protein [Clostridium sp.]|nr:magnesium transporter CorA family protein [Prevotella sp.]MCM1429384.1 magnesium transporter CorA family protein [Clostridium sp.]MCM1475581.1 magnesium transporter CorA family protein [Muribaculaceae bacterium]
MIKIYSYEEEGIVEREELQAHYWMDVENPDDKELDTLRNLDVPESFIESIEDPDERPRFDRENGWLMTLLRIPIHEHPNPLIYRTIPLGIMTKEEMVITICSHRTNLIADFVDHSNRRRINIDNNPDFILHLINASNYWYQHYLKKINDIVARYMKDLEAGVSNDILMNMMELQKALVYFNTSLKGNSMLTERLNKVFVDDCNVELLEDVEIELEQALNTVTIYMEILSNSMDTFASVISNNVNNVMKTMTSISIILMIPTLIASFYGMNVGVWQGGAPYAFGVIIFTSFVLSLLVWYWLRRKNWI